MDNRKLIEHAFLIDIERNKSLELNNQRNLTIFICDDHYRCTNISIPFSSRSKHCDAVVSVFMEPCQCCLHCGSNHYLGFWTTIRKSCVGNCVTQYNSILIKYGNISPLNQNTGRTRVISSDIRWRSVWSWKAKLDEWLKKKKTCSCTMENRLNTC